MMLNRFAGGFSVKSTYSVTPPVKSSIASGLLPPYRYSYEPYNLPDNTYYTRTVGEVNFR